MIRWLSSLSLMLVACGTTPTSRAAQVATLTGSAATGATLFSQTCASCHGADGTGTASAPTLVEPAQNDSVEEIADVIINGRSGTAMTAYGSTYTDQQIADLVAHIKTLAK